MENPQLGLKGKRKFAAFVIAIGVTAILNLFGTVGPDNVESIFMALIWAFVAGNAAEHASKSFGNTTS